MASRHFLRRLSPILRTTLRGLPMMRPALHLSSQTFRVTDHRYGYHLMTARCMCSNAQPQIVNIQDEDDFQKQVLDSKKPVVVDFHATWCGPCKLLGPRLQTIIAEQKGKVVMAKVDIDDNVELAMRYNVQSVPTVFGVKNGQVQDRFIGLKDDDHIKGFVEGLL